MSLAHIAQARSALVFIEFQHEWLSDNGFLQNQLIEDKEGLKRAQENAATVLSAARSEGWIIAHAGMDLSDDPDYKLFNGGKDVLGLRKAIPAAGTWQDKGPRFIEPFSPRKGEFVTAGRSGASVLKNSTLDPFLRNQDINTLFLMGFATHVCVESTLREAHDLGYNAYVVEDACSAFTQSQHDHVREHVIHHFGGETNAKELISRISHTPSS